MPSETNADFVFVPRDQQAPAVDISVSPESATTEDEITITAIASDTSSIAKLEISGELSKIVRGVGHCRTERYEGHDIEICEKYEHPINETIAQTCEADRCSFHIPRSDANYYKYEIKLRVSAYDRACNFSQRDFNLVFFKPAPIKMKNDRNTAAYRKREVFLVSDQDWRNVLSLLPVALGTECEETPDFFPPVIGRSCYFEDTAIKTAVPFIIFHHEDNNGPYQGGFDLDSAIVFINQYKAKNVTVFVGDENLHQYLDDELYFWLIDPHNALQSRSRSLSDNLNWFDRNPNAKIRFFDSRAISDVYKHYFSEINSVLVCEDNYEAALHCAVFAAKANMPLYFSGHYSLDDINGKIVHIAGNINPAEVRRIQAYAKELGSFFNAYVGIEYESPYAIDQLSAGPKNVLAATTDFNKPDSFDFNFRPRVASYLKVSAFWRNSLAAPVYAVARNGVLETFSDIPVMAYDDACGSTDYPNHRYLKGITDTVKERTRYMLPFTLIASPPYIPDSYYTGCSGSAQKRAQMDREYGALGRIYGLTVTDTSAYIARSIFYDEIVKERPKLPTLLISHSISAAEGGISESVDRLKASPNYDVNCYIGSGKTGCVKDTKPTIETYLNKNLIVFANHGSIADWSSTLAFFEIPGVNNEYYLEAPVVFGDACLTNNFWQGLTSTMGPNWIRYGAIAYFAAAGISHSPACISGYSYNTTSEYFIEQISKGGRVWTKKSLGEVNSALDKCTEECCMAGVCWIDLCSYKDYFILLGDPALVPNFKVR
ncbi:MAG: C25 family cysteine peptidase [Candidatus Diapherotrites archaeon]